MKETPEFFNFTTDVFDRWAALQPDTPALWWVNEQETETRRFTFAEMRDLSLRAARAFQESGIRPGDPVMILLPRVPEWWIAMLGLTRLGAVPVPCTPQLTPHDLTYRLETGNIHAVVTDAEGAAKLPDFDGIRWQIDAPLSGWKNFAEALVQTPLEFSAPATRASDPGIIYFTSATTGGPKMVLHTQASYGLGHRSHRPPVARSPPRRPPLEHRRPRLGQGRVVELLRPVALRRLLVRDGRAREILRQPHAGHAGEIPHQQPRAPRPPPCA